MKKINAQEMINNSLISKLIHNYMGLIEKDKNYPIVFDFIKNYLTNNSLVYTPQPREIEQKIFSLIEKLEINSQFEKGKLLFDLICRLKTIFTNKNIKVELVLNIIHIILQLAHSPMQTNIDIDMLRERFEERYIRHESNKIVRNMKFNIPADALAFTRTVNFDVVDYNEPSSEYEISEDEELKENEKCIEEVNKKDKKSQFIAPQSKILSKKIFCENDNMEIIEINQTPNLPNFQRGVVKVNNKLFLLSQLKKLLPINNFIIKRFPYIFNNTEWNKSLIDHLFKVNSRHEMNNLNTLTNIYYKIFLNNENVKYSISLPNLKNNFNSHNNDYDNTYKIIVDSDYILNTLLINLTYYDSRTIKDSNTFLNKFNNLICLDISDEVVENIIREFNCVIDNLNFLRQVEVVFERHDLKKSVAIGKFSHFIKEFLNCHDKILDSFIKLLNYQKGKISILNKDILFVVLPTTSSLIIKMMVYDFNNYLINILEEKFTFNKFFFYYKLEFLPYIKHIINITENIITIKSNLIRINKCSNTLLIKEILDFVYTFTKSKTNLIPKKEGCLILEIFFQMTESYLQIVYEFIINGNLIDINNEFFIDHMTTKKDIKKIIFNFNEKFKKFDWIDSFKIKSYNYQGIDGACVPLIFMIDNLHFKILETSKSTFLIKNLKSNEKINFDFLLNQNDEDIDLKKFKDNYTNYLNQIFEDGRDINNFIEEIETIVKNNNNLIVDQYNSNLQFKLTREISEDYNNIPFNTEEKSKNSKNIKLKFYENYDDLKYIDEDINRCSSSFIINNAQPIKNNLRYENENYKSYFINKSGKVEEFTELEKMKNLIKLTESNKSNNDNKYYSFNLDIIIKKLIHTKIIHINKIINQKLLNYLFDEENLIHHFDLVFSVYLFKAGFSMNRFVIQLSEFIQKGLQSDNFYLKSQLNDLTQNSDLLKYQFLICEYTQINFKENSGVYINNYHDFLTMEYQPKLPVSIFFDHNIINYYNSIFNFIVKIKKTNCIIKNIE